MHFFKMIKQFLDEEISVSIQNIFNITKAIQSDEKSKHIHYIEPKKNDIMAKVNFRKNLF